MKKATMLVAATCALAVAAPVTGQGIAVWGHGGTLGVGADAAISLVPRLGVRAGINVQPWEPKHTVDDVRFTLDLASPTYTAMADLYLLGGLRLTGGAVFFTRAHEVHAELTEPVEIGGQTYQPNEVGTLTGEFTTEKTAPYVGIGFGRLAGRRGLGFVMDLGVAFTGEPGVQLSADGPVSSLPQFQQDLLQEQQNMEEDLRKFRYFPVVSIGLVLGF